LLPCFTQQVDALTTHPR